MLEVSRENFKIEEKIKITYPSSRELNEVEQEMARIAWRYFENNTDEDTGLVNSVDGFPAATLWDIASYMLGLISAYKLDIVDADTFDSRIEKLLKSLYELDLYDGVLPNKSYNVKTKRMVDYTNKISDNGIGWSAIDIGRIMVPFNILVWNYPQHTKGVNRILSRWDMTYLVSRGVLVGATIDKKGKTKYVQEGRIGYEEYAAKSVSLAGIDVSVALQYSDFLKYVPIMGVDVPTDIRDPKKYKAHNYVVSESYILDAIEFGSDEISTQFSYRVYKAQENRYKKTGILTAVSEDNIDQAPYFVYNTVFSSGKAWNAITDSGEDASQFRSVSTKAALGWHMLYESDYTALLMKHIENNFDSEKGWFSGIYEKSNVPNKAITANTNAIVLESLHYKVFGPLLNISGKNNANKLDLLSVGKKMKS
ncbi:hypothetical protein A9Q99_00385 [Gammaproteobacteria bacterium 45_16_T64]|nr:hypothetical protein A9Q99_00385 [Gammaproteobacteria bacterium 45_16_T64]